MFWGWGGGGGGGQKIFLYDIRLLAFGSCLGVNEIVSSLGCSAA